LSGGSNRRHSLTVRCPRVLSGPTPKPCTLNRIWARVSFGWAVATTIDSAPNVTLTWKINSLTSVMTQRRFRPRTNLPLDPVLKDWARRLNRRSWRDRAGQSPTRRASRKRSCALSRHDPCLSRTVGLQPCAPLRRGDGAPAHTGESASHRDRPAFFFTGHTARDGMKR
jgi:hypothetical protein